MRASHVQSLGLALVSALLFALATPLSKWLLTGMAPIRLAGLLYLGAAMGVLPMVLHERRHQAGPLMSRTNRLRLGGAILCGGVLGPVIYLIGLRLASASTVSLWLNLELVATALLGHYVFRDYLGRFAWVGIGGVVGAGVLLTSADGASLAAAGLVALACLFWAVDNHLTALIDGLTPAGSTLWKGLSAGLLNLSLSVLIEGAWPRAAQVLIALAVGALSYGASIALYISAAQKLGATRAQLVFASSPFAAALLSVALLSEPLEWLHLVAAVLLVVAVALIVLDRQTHDHEHVHEAMDHVHGHRHDDEHHAHEHPGLPASAYHSHRHHHAPLVHRHPHWPDLHHRHKHKT